MPKNILKKLLLPILLFSPMLSMAGSRCYILGDSIAQGVAMNSPGCVSATKVGLNTTDAKNYFTAQGPLSFDNLVISLGINDAYKTQADIYRAWNNLVAIRSNLTATQVIWILPNKNYPYQEAVVKKLADAYGDRYIDVSTVTGHDGIHPTPQGYKVIAQTLSVNEKQ